MKEEEKGSGEVEAEIAPTSTQAPIQAMVSEPDSQNGTTEVKAAMSNPSIIGASLAVLLLVVLFSTGFVNVLLVLLCSTLLLLNPWVRTFLELPSVHPSSALGISKLSLYDPARLLHITADKSSDEPAEKQKELPENVKIPSKQTLGQIEAYAALRRMPPALRTPIADLEELIIRDFISSWYNYHSFAEQSMQNQARYSIDYTVGSAYAAMEHTRSADIVSEVLLTISSVLLTTLRTRRLYPGRAAIFSSNTARISALKEAMERLLNRHSKRQDVRCDLLRTLLVEILSKQTWNAVCGIGEPDFINRKIVEWGEAQRAKEVAESNSKGSNWPDESRLQASTSSPDQSRRSSAAPSPTPHGKSDDHLDVKRSSSVSGDRSPTLGRPQLTPIDSTGAKSPSIPSPGLRSGPASSEPLTMQPRAMVMPVPSPLGRSPHTDRSTFPSMNSTPTMSAPPLPKRPLGEKRANTDLPSTTSSLLSQPPQLPPRKDAKPPEPTRQDELAWSFMAMDIPPEARQGMVLPESLQQSLKKPNPEETVGDVEGYRISGERRRNQSQSDSSAARASSNSYDAGPSSAGGLTSSNDSQSYRVRSRPSSRPASSASGGIPPAPDLAEVLSSTDSPGMIALRDAFEAFMERGGAASRSLFFSPPSSATTAPGEGLALLKLHVGLSTLARLVPSDTSDEGEVYREDAYNVAVKALRSLRQVDDSIAGRPLREALLSSAQRLRNPNDGHLREVMRPVEITLWTRLSNLYDHFWKETCTRPAGSRPSIASPTLSSSGRQSFSSRRQSEEKFRSNADHLHYQPRKKATNNTQGSVAMSAENSQSGPEGSIGGKRSPLPPGSPLIQAIGIDSSPEIDQRRWLKEDSIKAEEGPPALPSRRNELAKPVAQKPEDQSFDGSMIDLGEGAADTSIAPSESFIEEPDALPNIEITVTDVSVNADRPDSIVDIRSYEFMIAVEGLVAGGGGFVLLRTWKDLQQLDEQLRLSSSSSSLDLTLPNVKDKTSITLTQAIEDYLIRLLSTPSLVDTDAVQYFVDKTRAGEPPSDRSSVLRDSLRMNRGLGLGKSIANGMGVVGKNAYNTLQMMPGSMAAMRGLSSKDISGDASAVKEEQEAQMIDGEGQHLETLPSGMRRGELDAARSSPRPPMHPGLPPRSQQQQQQQRQQDRSSLDLSPQELDNLLSCFFAIADEAFNLSGGWTLRRGLLRVLEQVVRTQYWTSIMGMFQNVSRSLNQEQMGLWLTYLTDMFWPDDAKSKASVNNQKETVATILAEKVALENDKRAEIAAEAIAEAVGVEEYKEEERSDDEKLACHLKAKSIIIAQTPVGSAYFLGPGGKQSCEKALNLLHEEICNPETSLDLALAVVLKLCDIVAR